MHAGRGQVAHDDSAHRCSPAASTCVIATERAATVDSGSSPSVPSAKGRQRPHGVPSMVLKSSTAPSAVAQASRLRCSRSARSSTAPAAFTRRTHRGADAAAAIGACQHRTTPSSPPVQHRTAPGPVAPSGASSSSTLRRVRLTTASPASRSSPRSCSSSSSPSSPARPRCQSRAPPSRPAEAINEPLNAIDVSPPPSYSPCSKRISRADSSPST